MSVDADYYDGLSARRHRVRLSSAAGRHLRVEAQDWQRSFALTDIRIAERLGSAPRRLSFTDGAQCEVADHAGFERLLAELDYRDSSVDRWQRSWIFAAISVVVLLAAFAAAYVWGLPLAAKLLAPRVPATIVEAIADRTLATLDQGLLKPSTLPAARRTALATRFAALDKPGAENLKPEILFRSAPSLGPNALALPNGQLIVLDELIKLADKDEQILGVLAHELGHVHLHHSLRQLIQTTLAGAVMAWWVGDFSTLLAAAPTVLLQTRYARGLEAEADDYAATLLRANGLSPARLAEMLEKLKTAHEPQGKPSKKSLWSDYLSTHPATDERIRALREPAAAIPRLGG